MSSKTWTKQQSDAISAMGGTILVSAAAGSGKTSVLVERVIKRLTDTESQTSADKLLIVTFTKAAAAEMKERIEKAVYDLLQKDPNNKVLRRQQSLIARMNISTIDSFCGKLVREHFYLLDIAPDFKIVADKQREELMNEAVNEVINEEFNDGMYEIADAFSSEKNDDKMVNVILSLYNFTNSHLFPEKWLLSRLNLYSEDTSVEKTLWGKLLIRYTGEVLHFCKQLTYNSLIAMGEDEKLMTSAIGIFTEDKITIEKLIDTVKNNGWNDISKALSEVSFKTFRAPAGYTSDPLKLRLAASRDTVKKRIKELIIVFCDTSDECCSDIDHMYPIVKRLGELVIAFSRRYSEKKRERKLADYADLELLAIKLLLKDEGDKITITSIAKEISERFDEIMIDEYQDTNEVQDWIFRAISKNDSNKFMVGDPKQCVYSFRKAMPEIFIDYKDSFQRYDREKDEYPATIVLDQNFRSRDTVINSVNYVFSQLMSKSTGGIDYVGDEALAQGANYRSGSGYETRVDFLEKDKELSTDIIEARHIVKFINETISSGIIISDGKVERVVEYKDFCVLLRNSNSHAPIYAKEMERLLVPAWAEVSKGFFASTEIMQVVSFLQVIDNPNQDIPLLSVLFGPIYGFTVDDIAELRIKNRKNSIYISILNNEKFKSLLTDLENYRLLAAVMPSDTFIDYLYTKTGYLNVALAMENGENRLANLRLLARYARDYESAGYIGISGFVRFIEKLKQSKSDMKSANLTSENVNVVRIMSIHKSKGLEFPICIVAGCGRQINARVEDVVLNSKLGLGLKLKDPDTGAKFTNIVREAVILQNKEEKISEELRLLYVAMTRAREKLFIISTIDSIDNLLAKLSAQISGESAVEPYTVKSALHMADWIMLCAVRHPMGRYLRDRIDADDSIVYKENLTPWDINIIPTTIEMPEKTKTEIVEINPNQELVSKIREKINFSYPNSELSQIPVKVTASALSEKSSGRVETLPRPSFLSSQGLTPAERGTALHSFMQFCDFRKSLTSPYSERDRLVNEGFITEEEGKVVNIAKVTAFLLSDIGKRMIASEEVFKEQRFTVEIPACMVKDGLPIELSDTPVILQGAVDCSFVERGKLYIVDFKTDRIDSDEELAMAYGMQLSLYARALEQVREMPVGGCYLYSLHKNTAVKIE